MKSLFNSTIAWVCTTIVLSTEKVIYNYYERKLQLQLHVVRNTEMYV